MKLVQALETSVKHTEKAEFLLDRGLQILWSKGYNGTSVNDIVCAADVPKGSFYFYFKSKEDFAVKALKRYFGSKHAATSAILEDRSVAPLQRLNAYYNKRVAKIKERLCTLGCMGSNIGTEMAEHSEMIRKTILNEEQKIRRQIIGVVEEAQERKEISSGVEADKIVAFIEDAYKGMLTSMKESQSPEPLDNFLFFLNSVLLK